MLILTGTILEFWLHFTLEASFFRPIRREIQFPAPHSSNDFCIPISTGYNLLLNRHLILIELELVELSERREREGNNQHMHDRVSQ